MSYPRFGLFRPLRKTWPGMDSRRVSEVCPGCGRLDWLYRYGGERICVECIREKEKNENHG